jgi:hypothetical protein
MDLSFLSRPIPNKATARSVHAVLRANGASNYELGLFFQALLRRQLWPSQTRLAESFDMSVKSVSRHVAVARLPIGVIEAFGDPRRVSWGVGDLLLSALDKLGESVVTARAKQAGALGYRAVDDILEFIVANRAPTAQQAKVSVRLARDKKTLRVEVPNMERLVPHLAKLESFLSTALLMFEANLSSEATSAVRRSTGEGGSPRHTAALARAAQRRTSEK